MTWLEFSRILASIGSSTIVVGLYLQAIKMHRTKSVDDFSTILVLSLVINELAWFNYGLALSEWPILLIAGLNIPAVFSMLLGYFMYRKDVKGS